MSAADFRYDGQTALIVGGATGMGAAAAHTLAGLGAELVVMDLRPVDYPVAAFIEVNLSDRDDVDRALAELTGPIDAVFSCAGVADGTPSLMAINFIAHRHIIEHLVAASVLTPASSVTFISSVAGLGWENHLDRALDFLRTPDWESAEKWLGEHPGTGDYSFSKQIVNAFVAHEAFRFRQAGVRLNGILPGPTDTPLAQANADLWLSFGVAYREELGQGPMLAEQMADTLAFLGSRAASGIAGTSVVVDHGQVSSATTGSYPDAIIDFLKTS